MTPEQWQSAKEIFASALELPSAERAAFLASTCGRDEDLERELASLLAAHEDTDNVLEKHALDLPARLEEKALGGRSFGAYRIRRELGRGGMGAVFLAEREDEAYQRQVAIKIIRQTIPDAALEQRFQQEREILALLNHPHIAILHDAGVSEHGEPFFVMEYIEGQPVIDFAWALPLPEKLNLFLKICSAVAYAHRNLVIHRDIKPSNILVTKDGQPKLLDFGLAKLLDQTAADETQTALRAFTPSYASPEQVRGEKITTASDVYSLGIVLYELLTNERPFQTDARTYDEILRQISEHEPAKPSEVISAGNPDSQAASRNQRLLKGDLDNIILMALRKEPERRYSSVEQFAQDIERYLQNLPVTARPNTLGYRAAKFFRRNRISVTAAAVILIVLLGAVAISFWQYRKAENEKAKAQEVNAFLKRMLLTASPANSSDKKGYSATINDVLNEATKRLANKDLANQPEVKAELQQIIGSCYLSQGQYDLAERYLREALATRTALFGADHFQSLETELTLAALAFARANYDEAEKIYAQWLSPARAEYRNGNLDAARFLASLNNYALLKRARGDSKQAEQLLRENLSIRAQSAGTDDEGKVTETLLALTELDQGKFDEVEAFARKEIASIQKTPDTEAAALGNALTLLGSVLMEKGALPEARDNLRAAEQIYRKLYSPNSIAIYDNIRLQAQVSYLTSNLTEAEQQISQVLENYRQNSNPKYINFATALTVQGLILNKLGKLDAAERILREALRVRTENLPPKHFMTALTKGALGEVLVSQKKYAEAETLLRESYEDLAQSQAGDNQRVIAARNRISALNANRS